MIQKIRKFNEIDDYNLVLDEIDKGNRAGLKCLFDTYIVDFYLIVYSEFRNCERTKDVLSEFFIDIWNAPDNFRLSDGNIDVRLYLVNQLNHYITQEKEKV